MAVGVDVGVAVKVAVGSGVAVGAGDNKPQAVSATEKPITIMPLSAVTPVQFLLSIARLLLKSVYKALPIPYHRTEHFTG